MGAEQSERLATAAESGTFGADIAGYAIDHVFGDIWTRKGLDQPRRSLITMAVMVAMRQPHEFGIHMNVALDHGMPLHEIEEALIQMLLTSGFPPFRMCCRLRRRSLPSEGSTRKPIMQAIEACSEKQPRRLARCPDEGVSAGHSLT